MFNWFKKKELSPSDSNWVRCVGSSLIPTRFINVDFVDQFLITHCDITHEYAIRMKSDGKIELLKSGLKSEKDAIRIIEQILPEKARPVILE